eukprot:CAMPEP_0178423756 /NCGR_PEP_ID=MMETSP0689_2-20121128/27851_1 /TAXON_ID=160604 /ORGANISM="Amphidinium massartii, Strain CS-259" /LENGTH=471 /DNA_ID=CAMNT_0020045357 /DNA_START=96 /DNA_END=1511 /DNA_ORIENTATION=+
MAPSPGRYPARACRKVARERSWLSTLAGVGACFLMQSSQADAIMLTLANSSRLPGIIEAGASSLAMFTTVDKPELADEGAVRWRDRTRLAASYDSMEDAMEAELKRMKRTAHNVSGHGSGRRSNNSRVVASNSSHSMVAHSASEATPQVFFLLQTLSGVDRPELWEAFFQGVDPKHYRILMHCKFHGMCDFKLGTDNPLGIELVDTVPTEYCTDLVSGMVQLVRNALPLSASPKDKFVFLSESTLPVKPFWTIYNGLTGDENSDFCIFPSRMWLSMHEKSGDVGRLVKHHQWMVLNLYHARVLSERWTGENAQLDGQHWSLPVCEGDCVAAIGEAKMGMLPRSLVAHCADEWAPFAMIYGIVIDHGQDSQEMQGLSHKPFWTHGFTVQGTCRTLTFWRSDGHEADAVMSHIFRDPDSHLSCYPCTDSHPTEFLQLSDASVRRLRDSSFFFARKFSDGAMSWEQFTSIILQY